MNKYIYNIMATVAELKAQAKRQRIKGYSTMKKSELMKVLKMPAERPKVKKQKSKLESMNVGDLRELACDRAVKKFGSMKKSELIKAVSRNEPKRSFKVKSNRMKEDETRQAETALSKRRSFKVKSNMRKEDETRPIEKLTDIKFKNDLVSSSFPEEDADKMRRVLQALAQNKKPPYDEPLTKSLINTYGIPSKKLNTFYKNKGFYIFAFDLDKVLREVKVRGVNDMGKTKLMAFKYVLNVD